MMPPELSTSPSRQPQLRAIATLCLALLSVSFAPILIRFSETELGANGTVFNRLLIFALVFGLGRFISYRLAPVEVAGPGATANAGAMDPTGKCGGYFCDFPGAVGHFPGIYHCGQVYAAQQSHPHLHQFGGMVIVGETV